MALIGYVANKIFDNNNVNYIIDKMHKLIDDSGIKSPELKLVLSGRVAVYLQGDTTVVPKQVILMTDQEGVYNFLLSEVEIKTVGKMCFKNRILYYFSDFYLEVWFSDLPLVISGIVPGVFVQNADDIPKELLS